MDSSLRDANGTSVNLTLHQDFYNLTSTVTSHMSNANYNFTSEDDDSANTSEMFLFLNDSNNNEYLNSSNISWWAVVPYSGSGYTQLSIILLAFFITCIMILIVVGNLLVCIAISTEKSLKTVQNWFIASLAVSDLLLGLVIMPFSLAYELMGYWIFGYWWCEVHHALDVLLCTASINNLCLISLDRYWSVTQAVEYLKKRTPARAMFMIGFVWSFSALVSLPPLFGWKSKPVEGQCTLSEDFGYVLYSSLGSFYVPALVMVFVYARIFVAARSRARRNIKKRRKPPELTVDATNRDKSITTCTSLSNPSPPDQSKASNAKGVSIISATCPPSNSKSQQQISSPLQIASSSIDGNNSPSAISPAALITPEIVVEVTPTPTSSPVKSSSPSDPSKNGAGISGGGLGPGDTSATTTAGGGGAGSGDRCVSFQTPATPQRGRNSANVEINYSMDDIEESDTAPESPGGIRSLPMRGLLAPTPLSRFKSSPYGSTLSIADFEDSDLCTEHDSSESKKVKNSTHSSHIPAPRVQASEAERHKRKVAKARERRATFILGLIMASFIGAWLPFFTMYLIQGICKDCKIDKGTFVVAFWLGYCNSAINPIIYTVFNRDFRKAFRKILFR